MWVVLYVLAVSNSNAPPHAEVNVLPYFEGFVWETQEQCEKELLAAYAKPKFFEGYSLKKSDGRIVLISETVYSFEKIHCTKIGD